MKILFLTLIFVFGSCVLARADTIYLKDGRQVQGLIKNQSDDTVELEVCIGGIIGYKKSEIDKIEESSPEEAANLRKQWEKEKGDSEKKQEKRKVEDEKAPKKVEFAIDAQEMMVDGELNGLVNVSLMLDTGASLVILKRSIADRLGIDLNSINRDVTLSVADGRQIKAKYVILNSVRIKDITASNVEAAIMMDNVEGAKFQDGLLGMSFLKRFNFKVDHKNNKLIIEKPAD
ncbi:MAG: retropepsin-like aspartic protease [Candidatus Omnitrophica bacterium]|nr:retropepsin-like aspartic protease [Candidatus Omnitrophota bacterium]